jgi:RND family efflux transporter MFP subunit
MKKKAIFLTMTGLLVAGLVVWVGYLVVKSYLTYNINAARKMETGVPVKVVSAKTEELPEIIGANSLAEPTLTIDVKTTLSGRIKNVGVDVGHIVSKGQKLSEIDSTLYIAAVQSAISNFDKAETNLKNSNLHLQRITNLYSQGVIAKAELEDAALSADTAKFNYSKAQEELLVAEDNLKNLTIKSPVNGVIMARQANPGENVRAGEQIFVIGEMQSIMVAANVPEEKVGSVFLRQEAEVVFDSYPTSPLKGYVEKIDPKTDPKTRTFRAYIKVKDSKLKLRPGLSAYTRLKYNRKALAIPSLSLIKNANESTVFVVEGSKAYIRSIKTGAEVSNKVEVLSGLQEGQQVVYYGLLNLKDGDLVNLQALEQNKLSKENHQ